MKKISTKQRSQLNDAQTLTEEELCATIDKNSGYIRFTLRKRRNQSEQDEEGEKGVAKTKIPALNGSSVPQQIRDIKRADALCAAAKKTRFHLSCDKSPAKDVASILGSRRHSELSSNSILSVQTNKLDNHISAATIQNQSPLSSSQNDTVVDASVRVLKPSDLNNNTNIAHLKLIDKQAAFNLKQWFSINLAGLIEYSQKFIQNGFDNLQFLNNPTLMNDQLLELIGIQDQSHRILILDRIYKELNEVNFDHLFNNLDQRTNQKLITSSIDLLKVLQLGHLVSVPDIDKSFDDLSTSESVNLWKEKYCSNLPLGYRIRISSAIDFLLNKYLLLDNKKQHSQLSRSNLEQQPITKQASVESNPSSEVDMDVSQASSVTTTSSSSSKDSIKSIVQMKQPQVSEETGKINQGDDRQLETKLNDSSDTKTKIEAKENEEETFNSSMNAEVIEQSKKVDDITSTITILPIQSKIDEDKPALVVLGAGKQGRTGSLVSEAARKLEAVAAQKSSGMFQVPVAAARRINNGPRVKSQASASNNVSRDNNKSSLTDKQPHRQPKANEDDKKSQQTTVFRNKTHFVPVKSINWPPKKQGKDSETLSNDNNNGTLGKSSSYQRHAEDLNSKKNSQDINKENNLERQTEQVVKSRPKPALPAKPAKLAANRYIFENNKS